MAIVATIFVMVLLKARSETGSDSYTFILVIGVIAVIEWFQMYYYSVCRAHISEVYIEMTSSEISGYSVVGSILSGGRSFKVSFSDIKAIELENEIKPEFANLMKSLKSNKIVIITSYAYYICIGIENAPEVYSYIKNTWEANK
jgi:hypothetical protein